MLLPERVVRLSGNGGLQVVSYPSYYPASSECTFGKFSSPTAHLTLDPSLTPEPLNLDSVESDQDELIRLTSKHKSCPYLKQFSRRFCRFVCAPPQKRKTATGGQLGNLQ